MTRHALPIGIVLAALTTPSRAGELRASLEGGADNDQVYTFAFLHCAVACMGIRL